MELKIALVAETFPKDSSELTDSLHEAKSKGATLVLLPECPAQPWVAATTLCSKRDAEPAGGPRESRQANAARANEIALLGGSIEQLEQEGRRNTAVLWDHQGEELLRYSKMHIPDEPGFREAAHYEPADSAVRCIDYKGWRIGVQICSDNQRPTGCQMLAAQGCDLILNPRATERTHREHAHTLCTISHDASPKISLERHRRIASVAILRKA